MNETKQQLQDRLAKAEADAERQLAHGTDQGEDEGAGAMSMPERIWARCHPESSQGYFQHIEGGGDIKYIRADIVAAKDAELEALRAEVDGLKDVMVSAVSDHEWSPEEEDSPPYIEKLHLYNNTSDPKWIEVFKQHKWPEGFSWEPNLKQKDVAS